MAFAGLEGRVALVTGAAGAIGSAIVERLLSENCKVLATDARQEALVRLSADHGKRPLVAVTADLGLEEGARKVVAAAVESFGGVDLVANAVGILGKSGPIADLTYDDFDKVYAVNVRAVF